MVKVSTEILSSTTVFNNQKCSCDTEDWSNDAVILCYHWNN